MPTVASVARHVAVLGRLLWAAPVVRTAAMRVATREE